MKFVGGVSVINVAYPILFNQVLIKKEGGSILCILERSGFRHLCNDNAVGKTASSKPHLCIS